jgi:hypothetical protein
MADGAKTYGTKSPACRYDFAKIGRTSSGVLSRSVSYWEEGEFP